jgi:hypothetical protein
MADRRGADRNEPPDRPPGAPVPAAPRRLPVVRPPMPLAALPGAPPGGTPAATHWRLRTVAELAPLDVEPWVLGPAFVQSIDDVGENPQGPPGGMRPVDPRRVADLLAAMRIAPPTCRAHVLALHTPTKRMFLFAHPRRCRALLAWWCATAHEGACRLVRNPVGFVPSPASDVHCGLLPVVPCPVLFPGPRYVVLQGHHVLRALQLRAAELRGLGQEVPVAIGEVMVTALRRTTPVRVRELLAGDHQARQNAAVPLSVADFAQLLLDDVRLPGAAPSREQRLAAAIRMSGGDISRPMVCVSRPALPVCNLPLRVAAVLFFFFLERRPHGARSRTRETPEFRSSGTLSPPRLRSSPWCATGARCSPWWRTCRRWHATACARWSATSGGRWWPPTSTGCARCGPRPPAVASPPPSASSTSPWSG